MKITNYTNAGQMPNESNFDYVIEVAAWADTGTTEYIGIEGSPTHDQLYDMLAAEVARVQQWLDEEPQVAVVRRRPEADEDGDYPPSNEWPTVIEWK